MSYEDEPFFQNSYESEPEEEQRGAQDRPHRFRRWRRSRPFWGGLFSILGGVEIALIPLSAYRIILVSHSVALAAVVGAVIAILGFLMWATPNQNKLYGLLVVLLGVVSFVTSNVGGFMIGGLLAILGGSLGFAWVVIGEERAPHAEALTGEARTEELPPLAPGQRPDPGEEPQAGAEDGRP